MYRLLLALFILNLLIGCRPKESSIFSDEFVSEKCISIVENFESWFNGDTINWLEETEWELVSTRHKETVIDVMATFQYPYGSEFTQVFALGYMDPTYAFPRIVRFKNSQNPLARKRVAEAIPLEGQYKERALRILVELLFDADEDVRLSVACTISRRLDKTDSVQFILLYYFENVYQKPVTRRDAINEPTTDWVEALADSKYRGVLVPWLDEIKDVGGFEEKYFIRRWMDNDPPAKWKFWWDDARVEQSKAVLEGKKIALQMKRKYIYSYVER